MGNKKSIIKLHFIGYQGSTTDLLDDFIYKSFCMLYKNVVLDDKNPDVVIFGCFNSEWLKYDCLRIFTGTEHFFPSSLFSDIMITSRSFNKNDLYYNSTVFVQEMIQFKQNKYKIPKIMDKRSFCNFIYGNKNAKIRNKFFEKMLNRFGDKLHSWGKHKTNIKKLKTSGGVITSDTDTTSIMKHYKFSICFENSSNYDSFSEKVPHALCGRSLPIYWGGDAIYNFIKKQAFINAKDFSNLDELVDYIEKVDNDDELYNSYILDDPFVDSELINYHIDLKQFSKQLESKLGNIKKNKPFCQKGIYAKFIFTILLKLYRRYFLLKSKKRRYFGGR